MKNNTKDLLVLLWIVFKALVTGSPDGTDKSLTGYSFEAVLVATFIVSMLLFVGAIIAALGIIKLFYC